MKRRTSSLKRNGIFILGAVFALCAAVFVFRQPLMARATLHLVIKSFPKTSSHKLTYKQSSVKDGSCFIENANLREDSFNLRIGSIKLEPGLNVKKLHLNPKLVLRNSLLKVDQKSRSKNLPFSLESLFPTAKYSLKLDIEEGILQFEDQSYFFEFKSGTNRDEIGRLSIAIDKEQPFLVADFRIENDLLFTKVDAKDVPAQHLSQLLAFLFPNLSFEVENIEGKIQLAGSAHFNRKGEPRSFSAAFELENFGMDYPEMQVSFQADRLRGDADCPFSQEPLSFNKIYCNTHIENASLEMKDGTSLNQLDGRLTLDPKKHPSLDLKGQLLSDKAPLALRLNGKGSLHDDEAYWMEISLLLDDNLGTKCETILSLCRPQNEATVLQLEAQNLQKNQAKMLKSYLAKHFKALDQWEILEGNFTGKLIGLFDQGKIARFEFQDLFAEQLEIALKENETPLLLQTLRGEGEITSWSPDLKGQFTLEMKMEPARALQFVSNDLKRSFEERGPDDLAKLTTTIRFENGTIDTQGSLVFLENQSLQFGFKSEQVFPNDISTVKEGWLRSTHLTEKIYGPFVTLFSEDLEIYGEVDLLGTFDGEQLDVALQFEDFLTKNPYFDLKGSQIGKEGNVKFTYIPSNGSWQAYLPLKGVDVYDRQFGLLLENLTGELSFQSEQPMVGTIKTAMISFDGKKLFDDAHFQFSTDFQNGSFHLKDLSSILALTTDKTYSLKSKSLSLNKDQSQVSFQVFDGTRSVLSVEAKKDEKWIGKVAMNDLLSLTGQLDLEYDWDPLHSKLALQAQSKQIDQQGKSLQNISLTLMKESEQFRIDSLKWDDSELCANFTFNEGDINLSSYEFNASNIKVKGRGGVGIDLPQKDRCFSIRSLLEGEAELVTPLSMYLKTMSPMKAAYCQDIGLLLSNVDLQVDDSIVKIEEYEGLGNRKNHAHNCDVIFSAQTIKKLIDAKMLPSLVSDLTLSQGVHTQFNLDLKKQKCVASGTIKDAAIWNEERSRDLGWDLNFNQRKRNVKVTIRDNPETAGLNFEGSLTKSGNLVFESIHGTIKPISADLKKHKKSQLKGQVSFDLTHFDQLFHLPMNRFVKLWQFGEGYQAKGIFSPAKRFVDWEFSGKLLGREFSFFGCQLRSLDARMQLGHGQVLIENLDVSDDAGKLWVNEGALMRVNDHWAFSFPLVEFRGFQPTFLRKINGPEISLTSLVIKSAAISNMRGHLDELSSISGLGTLRFVNPSKSRQFKGPSNLSKAALSQMGLESSLFTPTEGEVTFALQNGRCNIQELRGVYSDEKKSQFVPAPKTTIGFLDFEGNLFIDINMRQAVNPSIRKPLSLEIRGNLLEPDLLLR